MNDEAIDDKAFLLDPTVDISISSNDESYLDPNIDSNADKEEYPNITRVPPTPPNRWEPIIDPLQIFGSLGHLRRSESPTLQQFHPPRPAFRHRLDEIDDSRETYLPKGEIAQPFPWKDRVRDQIIALNYNPIEQYEDAGFTDTTTDDQTTGVESSLKLANITNVEGDYKDHIQATIPQLPVSSSYHYYTRGQCSMTNFPENHVALSPNTMFSHPTAPDCEWKISESHLGTSSPLTNLSEPSIVSQHDIPGPKPSLSNNRWTVSESIFSSSESPTVFWNLQDPKNIWPQGNMESFTTSSNQHISIENSQMYSNGLKMNSNSISTPISSCHQNQFQPLEGITCLGRTVNHTQLPQAPSYGDSGFNPSTCCLGWTDIVSSTPSMVTISGGPQLSSSYWNLKDKIYLPIIQIHRLKSI
nr:hypothetical transcript [Hymenolepis microstoma]